MPPWSSSSTPLIQVSGDGDNDIFGEQDLSEEEEGGHINITDPGGWSVCQGGSCDVRCEQVVTSQESVKSGVMRR